MMGEIREASSKMAVGFCKLEMREGHFGNKEQPGTILGGGKRGVYLVCSPVWL